MQTYEQWTDSVKTAFWGGVPTDASLLMAVKDGVMSVMARDVESDLQRSRSYETLFNAAKMRYAGARISTSSLGSLTNSVKTLLPVEADTDATLEALANAVEVKRDEINSLADQVDRFILEAAIELQRQVPFFQPRVLTTYLLGGSGVVTEGYYSRVALPTDARIQQLWFGRYYPALDADVEYEVGDVVVSNGRRYEVVVGGTLDIYQVAPGLISIDGEEETLGDLTFVLQSTTERDFPVRPISWGQRMNFTTGRNPRGTAYALSPQQDTLWMFPALTETSRFDLEWAGVIQEFDDSDQVSFDVVAAKAAAAYVRGMLQQTVFLDPRAAQVSLGLYQRALREAVLDNQDREAGPVAATVPYDWARNPRICGLAVAGTTSAYPNGYAERINTVGDITLESTAANMVIAMLVGGVARDSNIILKTAGRAAGDRLTVPMTLPAVAGINFEVFSGSLSGDSLLPADNFPGQVYSTDGDILSASLEFVFTGTAWEYVGIRAPA